MPDFFYVGFGNTYMKVTELFPQSFLYSYTVEMFLSGGSQDHKRAGPWQSHFKSLLYHIHRHPVGQLSSHDQCQCTVRFLFLPDKWTQVQSFQTAHIYIPFLWVWSPDMAQGLIVDSEEAMLAITWGLCWGSPGLLARPWQLWNSGQAARFQRQAGWIRMDAIFLGGHLSVVTYTQQRWPHFLY